LGHPAVWFLVAISPPTHGDSALFALCSPHKSATFVRGNDGWPFVSSELCGNPKTDYTAASFLGGVMDHLDEHWTTVYETAVAELEHAKIKGRIQDARNEIFTRMEKLLTLPGLHTEEVRAISDALSALIIIAAEEDAYDAKQKQLVIDHALQTLRSVAPTVLRTANPPSSE
jgi:hypothetical protein